MKSAKYLFSMLISAANPACSILTDVDRPANFADEGHIIVYTSLENDQIQRYLASFGQLYPNIDVSFERLSDGQIVERLTQEAGNPRADLVWSLGRSNVQVVESMNLLLPF